LAALFLESGLFEDALLQFRRLYEVAPESALGHRGLAESLIALHRYEEALAVVARGLREFPLDPSLTICWARLSLQSGDASEAVALLTPLAQREDDHGAESLAWLAIAHLTAEDLEGAIGAAQNAVKLVPDHPLASYALAIGLDDSNAPEAGRWLEQALRLNPNNPELAARIGRR
jgi:tetratricopeptide (TPR) repeat protein